MMLRFLIVCVLMAVCHGAGIPRSQKKVFNIFAKEKGAFVHEKVTIDEANGKELIEMPAHRYLDAVDALTSYNEGWTLRRFPDKKTCLYSDFDPSLFTDLNTTAKAFEKFQKKLWLREKVIKTEKVYRMSDLPKGVVVTTEMRAFCGNFPIIYAQLQDMKDIEQYESEDGVVFEIKKTYDHRRVRRQNFDGGLRAGAINCPWDLQASACKIRNNYCHYIATCKKEWDATANREISKCNEAHLYGDVRCCIPCCTAEEYANEEAPLCSKITVKILESKTQNARACTKRI